ncbi:hypothetical protein CEXT_634851 [Caerostris extrusa]|uniref:Uncharacterized protein n=1 Tax=Caerostris extrusa TaxID=172846 RepID=A0AAV4RC19_CAEEX|nr:hypothetical protein CEXT_634851 [Caerostris extrusa]
MQPLKQIICPPLLASMWTKPPSFIDTRVLRKSEWGWGGGCCRCIPRVLFIRHHTDPRHPAAEDVLSVVAPSVFFIPFHPSPTSPPPRAHEDCIPPATWGCEGGGGFLRERWMGGASGVSGNSDGRYCNRCFISLGGEEDFIAEDSAV